MDILRAVVNTMRTPGADGSDVIATCRRIVAEIHAEEREECAKLVRELAKRPRTDPNVVRAACAAFDEAEAAIRARGQS